MATGTTLIGLLATAFAYCHAVALPAINAPLAPATPGTRFAPDTFVSPQRDQKSAEMPPRSTGTHVTASLSRRDGSQLVAVWGDPLLWELRGETWRPARGLPLLSGKAAEAVGLTEDETTGQLVLRTRREGSFVAHRDAWQPLPRSNAPYDANAQAIIGYRGTLFVATLNDGLVLRDEKGVWRHVAPPVIGTNAPRQFVVWHEDLYVRHGDGTVDRFDGRTWLRDVLTKQLPRRQVSALATDGETLFLAQWAGWSQTRDGLTFQNHFPDELKNVPVLTLLPQQHTLFVGTQGRGLAECDRDTGAVRRWQDERQGITDDWITTLTQSPSGGIIAGTFVGGAFWNPGSSDAFPRWQPVAGTQRDCVTASAASPDAVFVALRRGGIRRYDNMGHLSTLATIPEAQCLFADETSHLLWVGTRTGVVVISQDTETESRATIRAFKKHPFCFRRNAPTKRSG